MNFFIFVSWLGQMGLLTQLRKTTVTTTNVFPPNSKCLTTIYGQRQLTRLLAPPESKTILTVTKNHPTFPPLNILRISFRLIPKPWPGEFILPSKTPQTLPISCILVILTRKSQPQSFQLLPNSFFRKTTLSFSFFASLLRYLRPLGFFSAAVHILGFCLQFLPPSDVFPLPSASRNFGLARFLLSDPCPSHFFRSSFDRFLFPYFFSIVFIEVNLKAFSFQKIDLLHFTSFFPPYFPTSSFLFTSFVKLIWTLHFFKGSLLRSQKIWSTSLLFIQPLEIFGS